MLTRADEPEWTPSVGRLLNLLQLQTAVLGSQHRVAPERHGAGGAGRNVIEHAHEGRVPAVLVALFQQAPHGLWGAPAGLQQTGQGDVRGGRRGWLQIGPEDDVHIGAAEAKGIDTHVASTDGQGPVHHLQPPFPKGRDLRVRAVEV